MTIDLDALEALEKKATQGPWFDDLHFSPREDAALIATARNALPELLRLARIGQRVERDAKENG